MVTIQYLNTSNNEILTTIIVKAKKESQVKNEVKNFIVHNPQYKLLSITKN